MSRLALFVATAGYAGFAPVAPGTAGSVVGLALYVVIRWFDSATLETGAIVVSLIVGIWAAGVVEKQLGKDPGPVVIDEVLGMLITLAFLDATVAAAIVGFFLFRLFDVLKPFPAGRLEHLAGGYGVMMDDAMAGIYSHVVLRLLLMFRPEWFV